MLHLRKYIIPLALLLLGASSAFAQRGLKQELKPGEILIGERARLTATLILRPDEHAALPEPTIGDEWVPGVEVCGVGAVDTVSQGKEFVRVQRSYELTSFDTATYALPPLKLASSLGDTLTGNPVVLTVHTVAVDTAHLDRFSLEKGILDSPEPPLSFFEKVYLALCHNAWLGAAVLIALAASLLLRLWLRRASARQRGQGRTSPPTLAESTLTLLAKLRPRAEQEGQGDDGAYYEELSEVLLRYVGARFGISTSGLTAGEVAEKLREQEEKQGQFGQLMASAELAKFARSIAHSPERRADLAAAEAFVHHTEPKKTASGSAKHEGLRPVVDGRQKTVRLLRWLHLLAVCATLCLSVALAWAVYTEF